MRRQPDLLDWLDAQYRGAASDAALSTAVRPTTAGDCRAGGPAHVRPCPWVSCRYHLAITQIDRDGTVTPWRAERSAGGNPDRIRPDRAPDEDAVQERLVGVIGTMPMTCVLDLAELADDRTLSSIGHACGIGAWAARVAAHEGLTDLRAEVDENA